MTSSITILEMPGFSQMPEYFSASPQFRWAVPAGTTTKPPVLEQAWRGSLGSIRWEIVPTEVVE